MWYRKEKTMKKNRILLAALCLFTLTGFTPHVPAVQVDANDIVGTYWTAEKDAKVRVFLAKNGKYSAKTVWMKEPNNSDGTPKKDTENPNEKLRDRTRMGMVFLKSFEFNPDNKRWENGTVYDPRSGKLYDGYLRFEGEDKSTLYLRGYVAGMTWLGKTSEWTRVE